MRGSETLCLNLIEVFTLVPPCSLLGSRRAYKISHELGMETHTLHDCSSSNQGDSRVRTIGTASPGCHGIEPVGVGSNVEMVLLPLDPAQRRHVVGAIDLSSTRRGRAEEKFSDRLHADETADEPMRQIRKGVTSLASFGP